MILICFNIIVGVFGALQQTKIKRFLIFSMIANAAFLLLPFILLDIDGDAVTLFLYFVLVYSLNLIGIFFLFGVLVD